MRTEHSPVPPLLRDLWIPVFGVAFHVAVMLALLAPILSHAAFNLTMNYTILCWL